MEKELALALDFQDAPDELKKAAALHRANYNRLRKAQGQVALWNEERALANRAYNESSEQFQKGVTVWTTEKVREDFRGEISGVVADAEKL